MPQFKYKALNAKGKSVSGVLNAVSELELEHKLQTIGLDLVDQTIVTESTFMQSKTVTMHDLIIMCVQLEQLEKAGVPLLDAIGDMRDTSDSHPVKNLMASIYDSISQGNMLSQALSEHPNIFDQVFVGLVSAGEKTGNLGDVFHHLAEHLKWVDEIRNKIKKASYYPVFLVLLMIGVISVMMLFVIPQLSKFLIAQGFDLPIYTLALIATSKFFESNWPLIFIVPIVFFTTIKIGCKISYEFKFSVHALLLKIPKIGETIRKIEMARFCRFLSITYRSGINILDCLDIAQNVVNNLVIKEAVGYVKTGVSEGNSLTGSMVLSNQFPSMVIRMIKVGEESGRIDSTLENVNYFFDREVNDSVNSMIGMIQPTLTLILGGIMLWVSVAVFGPLYSSLTKLRF
ncbi:MAG: type II secretion system F family protein [Sphingobacteriia bacterium]|nr:type II secretion system F family protein [Sphingobacteriia bacterium]